LLRTPGARSRDPVARNDVEKTKRGANTIQSARGNGTIARTRI
jgi:hypothetical protein